jgi:hypothetical protein
MMRDIHFISRFDTDNVGDRWSSPYHFFDFDGFNKKTIPWAGTKKYRSEGDHFATIIGGGLFGPGSIRPIIESQPNSKFVYWGGGWPRVVGYDKRKINLQTEKFNLNFPFSQMPFGIRDYCEHLEFVPCASCMLPQLDKKYSIKRDVGVYYHSGYTKRDWYNKDTDIRYLPHDNMHNHCDINDVIKFIGESETIITSSYHGAYWGVLLGKNVEIGDPLKSRPTPPKTDTLKLDITLEEARHLNTKFYDKVMNYLT